MTRRERVDQINAAAAVGPVVLDETFEDAAGYRIARICEDLTADIYLHPVGRERRELIWQFTGEDVDRIYEQLRQAGG